MESSRRKCTFGDAIRLRRFHARWRVIPYQVCGLNKKRQFSVEICRFLVRVTGLDSRRELRGLVVRGSDSPLDCHSLPLLLQVLFLLKKEKGEDELPLSLFGAGDRTWTCTALRPIEPESIASANSATPAYLVVSEPLFSTRQTNFRCLIRKGCDWGRNALEN